MTPTRPSGRRRTGDERGVVTPFVVLITLALLIAVGLVYDGGTVLGGRREAAGLASSAARLGSQAINEHVVRGGSGELVDVPRAQQLVDEYLQGTGASAVVTYDAGANLVRVQLTMDVDLEILTIAGLTTRRVTATRTATPLIGVNGPGT